MVFNGAPFMDHWAFWIPTAKDPKIGVVIHATGDVRNGFTFQVKRSLDLRATSDQPSKTIPLQWVDGKFFNEKAMLNNGTCMLDNEPACAFEASAYKAKPPIKSLNAVNDPATRGVPVEQRNCQTWIVEAAAHLVDDGIMSKEVAAYLNAIKQ
ncbi:hypothetical protein F4777DRAFT_591402 [Nemania sp. FL0916]|nr:hypothetical protein F4777DRAFT_591402 [Nemania sp. FL0916]